MSLYFSNYSIIGGLVSFRITLNIPYRFFVALVQQGYYLDDRYVQITLTIKRIYSSFSYK